MRTRLSFVRLSQTAHRATGGAVAPRVRGKTCTAAGQILQGLQDLPRRYQGVLLDQFGVLHDGKTAYPAAVPAVRWMHEQGLKVLILSNSSKRSHNALQRIQQLGYDAAWFDGAITSGEVTHVQLTNRPTTELKQLGRRCLHFTWKTRGTVSLENFDLQVVPTPADADFILAHGTEALGQADGAEPQAVSMHEINHLLQSCAEQQPLPPMVVANPDVVTVSGSDLIPMPGTLAEYYSSLGGQILWMGKPDPVIYDVALDMLQLPKESVLAIGDSLQHDIQGAYNAGLDSVFITGGIHADDIAASGGDIDEQTMLQLFRKHKGEPTYTMPALQV